MSVRHFFDNTAVIKRTKAIAGTDKSRLSSTATAECNIQQLDAETVLKMEGVFGEEYVLFCEPSVNIRENDRVEADGVSYKVKEVIEASLFGIEQFKQVYMTKYAD
jgi:hypothetical protein